MNPNTFFTLADYKSNFERLKKKFLDLQTEWYQRCLDNTMLEYGIVAASVGGDTKAMITGEN